jgi:hypothetical protein
MPQIAERLGCSKSFAPLTLKQQGLLRRPKGIAQINPRNYRNPIPPYGYQVIEGRLVPSPEEMKVCHLIVDLIDRQGLNYSDVSRRFKEGRVLNRRGTPKWHHQSISNVYARWKGKI